jgi:hypothetical protein
MTVLGGETDSFSLNYTSSGGGFNYSLSNSGPTSITQGNSGQTTVTANLVSSPTQSVTFALSGVPAGVSASVAPSTCSPTCTSTVTFTVASTVTPGHYFITVTGSPLNKTTTIDLNVVGSVALGVSCVPTPSTALIGNPVTWTGSATGGVPPYTYTWTGTNIPTSPAPSNASFSQAYSTVGTKLAQLTVTDSASNTASCVPPATVQINFNPKFQEF